MTTPTKREAGFRDQPQESPARPDRVALRCRSLAKRFGHNAIVRDVSLTLKAGDILALVGPSGCGKTTTLRLIAGFERLDEGSIEVDGRLVADNERHLPPENRRVGMVFQDYAIFPHLNVGQNVGFVLGKGNVARERVAELLAFVGLPEQEQRMPYELSGGEQQRVSLARALSTRPALLLLDEPFSNLDATLRTGMRTEVRALLKESGATAIFVTHDQEEALVLGDQVGVMRNGQLEQLDTPEGIFHRPRTRFVAEFLGHTQFIPGMATETGIDSPLGFMARPPLFAPGNAVEIAVRPDDVTFTPDAEGSAHIVARQFMGMTYFYRIALPDGTIVHSQQPHEVQVAEGTRISARFSNGATPPIFALRETHSHPR